MTKITRIHAEREHIPKEPRPLELPERSPHPSEIKTLRSLSGISQSQAATICGVGVRQIKRWEHGKARMPRAAWAWMNVYLNGAPAAGGPGWKGWSFHDEKLWDPKGWGGFTANELSSWPYIHAQIADLKKQLRQLKNENRTLRDKKYSPRAVAYGQIDMVCKLLSQMYTEAEEHDDELLHQLQEPLFQTLKTACELKIPLLTTRDTGT